MADLSTAPVAWYHAQIWCYGQWLPGDTRGFRSKAHRIHSSGDYRNPPLPGEHAELFRHATQSLSEPPVTLRPEQYPIIGHAIARWFELKRFKLIALSVGDKHGHLLCQLPVESGTEALGRAKKYASERLRKSDPSSPKRVFAKGGPPKPIRDDDHLANVYDYITEKHACEGHWIYSAARDALNSLTL